MWIKKVRNISFQVKMTLIFTVVCIFATSVAGVLYYKYSEEEIVNSFTVNAESLVSQMESILDTRLEAISRKTFAMLTNPSFSETLSDYLNDPEIKKEVITSSAAANWLKEIRQAEPLVSSVMIYSEMESWDDYTKSRNWDFEFQNSTFKQYFGDENSKAVQWLPAMTDELFKGEEQVIPYVRRFTTEEYKKKPLYLIIQISQKVLLKEITGSNKKLGQIVITDSNGGFIASTMEISSSDIKRFISEDKKSGKDSKNEVEYLGEKYLVYKATLGVNDWNIFLLKSRNELLDNISGLRRLIVGMTVILSLVSIVIVAILSRQLTLALKRLSIQMNRMRDGEMDARYYYPYHDEVGSLARSFNYMADEIEKSMKKQEEYIAILKEERDLAAQVQKQKRKAELRALQAQINPHFLYNTLNMITWLASDKGVDEIRILSNSLGRFFRISLSKGAEAILISEELEHVKSYLCIQEIRYSEIMQYEISIPEQLKKYTMLKLTLQPLVENSIYHGIKEKGVKCKIRIQAELINDCDEECIRFQVEDNGIGISEEKLKSINAGLKKGITDTRDGYGIFNVNERIKLYYGEKYGLSYESCEGEWTRAILIIPIKRQEED